MMSVEAEVSDLNGWNKQKPLPIGDRLAISYFIAKPARALKDWTWSTMNSG